MEKSFHVNDDQLVEYVRQTFRPEDEILEQVRKNSDEAGVPAIQVGKEDGLHLEVLARAIGARKIVEIGTLGGYSGICFARALPEDGKLYTFEIDERNAKVAQESFKLAKVDHKVEILLGPALDKLPEIEKNGPFDLVFIDADKSNYPNYLEWAYQNLRKGGVVLGDNTFAFGHIHKPDDQLSEHKNAVYAIRKFNSGCADRSRFRGTILPTGEGLTVAVKL